MNKLQFLLQVIVALVTLAGTGGLSQVQASTAWCTVSPDRIQRELTALHHLIDSMEDPHDGTVIEQAKKRKGELVAEMAHDDEVCPEYAGRRNLEIQVLKTVVEQAQVGDFDGVMLTIVERKKELKARQLELRGLESDLTKSVENLNGLSGEELAEAQKAQAEYNQALVNLFSLITDEKQKYQFWNAAQAVHSSYKRYVENSTITLEYMNAKEFNEFFQIEKQKADKLDEMDAERDVTGFRSLEDLKYDGEKFNNIIQNTPLEMTYNRGAQQYYYETKADLEFTLRDSESMKAALKEYVRLVEERKIPVQEFNDSKAAMLKAKYDLKVYMEVTPSLKALGDILYLEVHEHVYWFDIALNNGLPTLQWIEEKNQSYPYYKYIDQEYELIKAINDSEREQFDALFRNVTDKVEAWFTATKNLDDGIQKLNEELNAGIVSLGESIASLEETTEGKDRATPQQIGKAFEEPIKERQQIQKTWKSLNTLNSKSKYMEEKKFQKATGSSSGTWKNAVFISVAIVAVALGGVVYCKLARKCCFAEKDDYEGGASQGDRVLFKKQVKSKNSHKRRAKESLVPNFKVVEDHNV